MGSRSTKSGFPVSAPIPATLANISREWGRARRRRVSPEAGRALEILGHAIDYLSDEFVNAGGSLSAHNAQVEAMQLLMGINRQIYFACPEVPSVAERWRALVHREATSSS
jgi:hypothetical protein